MLTTGRGARGLWLAALLALGGLTGAAQQGVTSLTQDPVTAAAQQAVPQTPAQDPVVADPAAQDPATQEQAAGAVAAAAEPDGDLDGMPDAWEDFFGLNKADPMDATGDLDGDGVSNLQEYLTKGHPNGKIHRYFAEGSTGFFRTSIGLFNPSATQVAAVQVSFITELGTTYTKRVALQPRHRSTVSANTELGFVIIGISTHVESNIPIAADRFMRWGLTNYGSSLDSGVESPSTTWYFSEGATGPFALYYLLLNPGNTPANVQIKYLREGGSPIIKNVTVQPHRRETVFVNTQDLSLLVAAVGAVVSSNVPIVAERAMYFSSLLELFGAGGASSGASALSKTWYFAEGATGPFFDEYILLGNPSMLPADAEVTFRRDDGTSYVAHYSVAPQTRRTIWINQEASSVPALAALATGPVSVTVRSDEAIVAERSMWWKRGSPWYEVHSSPGLTTPATTWMIGEAAFDGPTNDQTFVLIVNTSATAGTVRVTAIKDNGTTDFEDYPLAAFARQTVEVGPTFGLANDRVSVLVESQGPTPIPTVVEYVRYSTTGFRQWNAGAAASAIPLIAPIVDTAPTVVSTAPAAGATNVARNTNLTVTFSEPVNVTATAFTLECPGGTPIPFTNLTASPATVFTLDPTSNLPLSASCVLKVIATQVTDTDTNDPPDQMAADVTVPFSTSGCAALTITPTSLSPGDVGVPYGPVNFSQTGGSAPITWTVSAGTLPAGLTLTTAGVLSGTPTTSGTATFDVTATDADSCSAAVSLSVSTSCPTITVAPSTLAPASVGTAYTPVQFTQTGASTPVTWSLTAGALPAGMAFSAGGLLSGTPTAPGTYSMTFTATDENGCAGTVTVTLSVSCPVITVAPTTVGDATVGVAYTPVQFTQTGSPTAVTWSVTSGTLPLGMTLSPAGLLSGTPTAPGTHTLTFTATDENGCTGTVTVTLQVTCPVITVAPTTVGDATVGVAYTPVQFTQTGSPTTVTWTLTTGTLPTGMTFSPSGLLSGTPTVPGTHTLTFTATDENGCTGTVTVTLQVSCPVITIAPTTLADAVVGAAYTPVQFTQTGSPTTVTWALTTGTLPIGMTFSSSGLLSGTPTVPGTHTLTFTATDANGCTGTVTVTLQVSCPVITITPATLVDAVVGVAYTPVQFTQTGSPTAVTWAVTNGALPTGMSFDANGLFSGTPTVPGTYTFTITATDANGCTGTITVTIQASCPTITVSPNTLSNGTAGVAYGPVTLTQTGAPTAVTWALSAGTLPAGVTLTAGGVLSGTPTVVGSFPFTAQATDANGCSGSQALTLQINCPTITITPSSVTNASVGTAYTPVTFSQTGAVGTVTWAMTSGTLPTGMTFNPATRQLSGTPTQAGTFTFTLTATDANGCAGTITITFDATCPVITISPSTLANAVGGVPYSQLFTVTGGASPHTWSLTGTLPTGMTFTPGTQTLAGTPTQPGVFPLTISAPDANGCPASVSPTLTVLPNAVNDVFPGGNVLGNVVVSSGAFSVLSNDVLGNTPSIASYDATSANGGTVIMVTSGAGAGTFTYEPAAGFEGVDTFGYVGSTGTQTDPATVTITVGGMIWFINGAAACPCDGRLSKPFATLAAFTAINDGAGNHPADNDNIFLTEGAAYTGPITLRNGQRLIGQDAVGTTLQAIAGVTPHPNNTPLPAMQSGNGTFAQINGSGATVITLGQNNTVRGLRVQTGAAGTVGISGNGFGTATINDARVSGSGPAVSLTNGAPNATFVALASNGAVNGLILTNTTGSFTVTGDSGGTNNGSGGVIQNTTGHGVVMNNATNVSLGYMNISPTGALTDAILVAEPKGTLAVTRSNLTNAPHNNFTLTMGAGTLSSLSLTNSVLSGAVGNSNADLALSGTATVTAVTVTGTTFQNAFADGLQIDVTGTATLTTATVQNSTFTGNNLAMDLVQNAAGTVTYRVLTNTITNHRSHAINAFTNPVSTTAGTMRLRIEGNSIGTLGTADSGSAIGNAMRINLNGDARSIVQVTNNQIHEVPNARTIEVIRRLAASGSAQAADVTITNNTVTAPAAASPAALAGACPSAAPCPGAVYYLNADPAAGPAVAVNSNISGNTAYDPTAAMFPFGSEGAYRLRELAGGTHQLVGAAGSAAAQISGTNTGTPVNVDAGVSLIPGPIVTPP